MFSATVPGLIECYKGACFPGSPAMAVISFIYSYILVGAGSSLWDGLTGAFKGPEPEKGAEE